MDNACRNIRLFLSAGFVGCLYFATLKYPQATIHEAVRASTTKQTPGKVPPYIVVERRRDLEWLLSDEDWDDISLDT